MEENLKYEEAMAQIEAIVHKMENNELDIDELAAVYRNKPKEREWNCGP